MTSIRDVSAPIVRDTYIDTIRGIACIALVSFHVVGDTPRSGLELPSDDWLVTIQLCLADMRMPLFSFISGYVFTSLLRPQGSWAVLIRSKLRRLLLPMISVGTFYYLLRAAMNYPQPQLWEIYVGPYLHFWFLQATLLMMASLLCINMLTTRAKRNDTRRAAINAAILGSVGAIGTISGVTLGIPFFSISHAFYLAPFFMTGHVLGLFTHKWSVEPSLRTSFPALILLLFAASLSVALAFEYVTPGNEIRRTLAILIGLITAITLFIIKPRNRVLAWIGGMSYAIYLFHVLFTASTGMVIGKAFPNLDVHYMYIPILVAGIIGPIILQMVLLKSGWLSFCMLGLRAPKTASAMPPRDLLKS